MSETQVLLVEDDLWVARVHRELVEEQAGTRVVGVAGSCAEAGRLLETLRPDLLLLDVYLPDGSGLELLARLRAQGSTADVIMLTAAHDLGTVQRALTLGASDYIIKPFDRARLHEAMQRLSARRRHLHPQLTQQHLDRYLGVQGTQTLPKGIDADTLARIEQLLSDRRRPDRQPGGEQSGTGQSGVGQPGIGAGSLSAEEVGAGVGVSRVTAWRYLEYLVGGGRAELDFSYGLPGRPTKLYRGLGGERRE